MYKCELFEVSFGHMDIQLRDRNLSGFINNIFICVLKMNKSLTIQNNVTYNIILGQSGSITCKIVHYSQFKCYKPADDSFINAGKSNSSQAEWQKYIYETLASVFTWMIVAGPK